MTTRDSPIARALRIAVSDEAQVRAEIARRRRGAGLSQRQVGRACGLSRSQVARTETGTRPILLRDLASLGGAVGLEVRLRAFPAGDAIRDIGQQRLLDRLRARLHPRLGWRTEVPLAIEGDLRAWDAVIRADRWTLGVEAETVLDDLQAVERRINLKRRDGRLGHLVVLVADTRRNRLALAASPAAFPGFGRDARGLLRALAEGRNPGRDGLVVL